MEPVLITREVLVTMGFLHYSTVTVQVLLINRVLASSSMLLGWRV